MPLDTPAQPAAPAAPAAPAPIPPAAAPETPAAPAAIPPAQPVAPPPIPADPTIPLPKSLYDDLIAAKASLAAFQRGQEEQQRAAQQEQARVLAEKGEIQAAMKILQDQTEQTLAAERAAKAAIEERAKRYALDGELSRALAEYDFRNAKLRELFINEIRTDFVVEAQDDTFAVRTPTFQPVAAAIAAKMALPEYQEFLRPKGNPGGGTQPNPAAPAPVNPAALHQPIPEPAAAQPLNAGQAIIDYYKAERAKLGAAASTAYVPARPIGLGPIA